MSNIFSGHYEIHIILLLVTALNIVVTMCTTYHFGTILESNSYLQNMVITLKFINLCNTATITHGNAYASILKLVFSSSCSHGLPGFLVPRRVLFVLGNICERFCASRPLLGSYVHQESI